MNEKENWVLTWAQAHAALSLTHFISDNMTYRIVLNSAVSGEKIRVRLSNVCLKNDVEIGGISCAVCDENGTVKSDGEIVKMTVNNSSSCILKAGEEVLTDKADFSVKVNEYICVSVYVVKGKLESGNALVNAKVFYEKGDCTQKTAISQDERSRNKVLKAVTGVIGIKQPLPIPIFESVELMNNEEAKAIILFGDSLTQQGKWSMTFEEKIRESFPGKYSVINKSITGNRVLKDCSSVALLKNFYGISSKNRLERDVLRFDNVDSVIMCLGINDILQPGTIDARKGDLCTCNELYDGVIELAERIKEKKIRLIAANYIPFGLATGGKSSTKEQIRKDVNKKLAAKNNFDVLLDWSRIFEDEQNPALPRREFVGNDKMHPSEAGGKALADSVDIGFFE